MKKNCLLITAIGLFLLLFSVKEAKAAITEAKDTISTSRPSAMTSLAVGSSAGDTKLIITDNKSRFIASDSAALIGGVGEVVTIASMSAVSGTTAALYLTEATTVSHNVGSTVMTAITAQHVISFKTTNAIPDNGDIQITFPVGDTTNPNYPSPDGFSFNGLADTDLSASFSPSGPTCDSWTVTPGSGLVQCNLGTGPTGPTTVTINIGLSRTNPVLVNPTKDSSTAIGTADRWTVALKTRDNNDTELDSSKVSIATIESVQVYATVEPYITFTIAGVPDGVAVNTGNAGCGSTDPTNTGIGSTATTVNLGVLTDTKVSLAAQLLTVTTNGNYGYSLTATSSGHLMDPAIGYWLTDAQGSEPTADNTPSPGTIAAGDAEFGIRPCGQDAYYSSTPGDFWGSDPCSADGGCKFANPSATYYYTLADDSTGPIGSGSGDGANDGKTTVEYAASISTIVPAGFYRTTITYVATAKF